MSLEVVDELTTPGCPQCAVKHLSAALSYLTSPRRHGFVAGSVVWMAVAKINLAEVLLGYRSHLWYAVGMLQRSEEAALAEGSAHATARHARLTLEERGFEGVADALHELEIGVVIEDDVMCEAHLYEAARELPEGLDYPVTPSAKVLLETIERIRKEYFDLPEAAVAEGETTTMQGEPEMATTKKSACKGGSCSPKGAKGAKCAEKGGTTSKVAKAVKAAAKATAAKACAKGGKCKK